MIPPSLKSLFSCDWDDPKPGQRLVDPGVIIMGYPGDPVPPRGKHLKRPTWTKDGAFMVFRKLEQNVLFFEDYIDEYAGRLHVPGVKLDEEQKKALLGARMFGRFKSVSLHSLDEGSGSLIPVIITGRPACSQPLQRGP